MKSSLAIVPAPCGLTTGARPGDETVSSFRDERDTFGRAARIRAMQSMAGTVVSAAARAGNLPLAGDWRSVVVRRYGRELLALGLLMSTAFAAGARLAHSEPRAAPSIVAAASTPAMQLRNVSREAALHINSATPIAADADPPASPFVFRGDPVAREQALQCLTSAVYYEAGNQGEDGERAVAQVVLNRVRHPAFPASICGVVYQGSKSAGASQFTFTADGSLRREPDRAGWARAYRIAESALDGQVFAPVGWATHYHADYVLPAWASMLVKSAVIGAHIFYRWPADSGRPDAFVQAYAGREPNASALRNAAEASIADQHHEAIASPPIGGAAPFPFRLSTGDDNQDGVRAAADSGAGKQDMAASPGKPEKLRWTLSSAGDSE
jgi:spore germination cell wall hydrolase CwlJ-like protein